MDADGQVEPQTESVAVQSLPQVVELAAHQRLGHEVEALLAGIDVLGLQRSRLEPADGQSRQFLPSRACAPRNRA